MPKFGADLFKLADTDYWLIPTAEVPVTNLFADETLEAAQLPIRLAAFTPCFRSEAGSYGRDVRGIIRQHQFQKVEMVKFTLPEQSYDELESLTANAEDILKRLGLPLPHRGALQRRHGIRQRQDLRHRGLAAGAQRVQRNLLLQQLRDVSGAAGQAFAIAIRPQKGKSQFVHTLNGSGLAMGRTWVAIVENYQQKDGSVVFPEALRPYLNAERIVAGGELK